MEQFLQQLEDSMGIPASLVERAAKARAGAMGVSTESVVRSWAGVGDAPAPAAAPADAPAAAPSPAPAAAAAPAAPALEVEILDSLEPLPEDEEEEDEPVPAGLLAGFPAWLAGALLAIPILALSYVMIAPNGPGCGSSGQLAIDAETGLAENCDGTEYGVDVVSFFSIGEEVYNGTGRCAGCHGEMGDGGTGPAMSGGAVLVTFPVSQCEDHISWVAIGSDDWPDATYGANATPVGSSGAAMPGFGETLTPEELVAVIIYERVAFGDQSLSEAETECGADDLEIAAGE